MKVLFFIHSLDGGGAESQLRHLARGLVSERHEVHVAYAQGDRSLLDGSGVVLHPLSPGSSYSFRALVDVMRLIRALSPDIVQTWTLRLDVLVGLSRLVKPFHWIIRESNNLSGQQLGLKARLRIFLARRASHIVANSTGGADYWRHYGLADVSVIENGYDMAFLDAVRPAHPEDGIPYLCYLGRLSSHKRVDRVLEAAALMGTQGLAVEIIGDGSQRDELERKASALELDARFRGYLPQAQALAMVKGAKALVLLSDYEGTPNVVLEAQYLGVPVILSDSDSHRSFFSAETAWLIPSDNTPAVAAAMDEAASSTPAVDQRAIAAKAFAAQWSVEKMVHRYMALYQEMAGKKPGNTE